jgi:hypothetical protein
LHARLASSKSSLVTDVSELEMVDGMDYSGAHFRMFHYKVDMCPHEDCIHDTEACPYVHPGDKSRRRNPGVVTYQPVPCPHFRKGNCRMGDACPLSHGVFECWLHPSKYRTQLCTEGSHCKRELCFFAHSLDELREPFDDCAPCSKAMCQASASVTPKNLASSGSSEASSPSQGSISLFSEHDIACFDKKIATLQATASERERVRRETAVAGIAETLKSLAVGWNAALQFPSIHPHTTQKQSQNHSLYKRTHVHDAASVLSIPSSDSSVSLAFGSSEDCYPILV